MQHRSAGRVVEIARYPVKGLGGESLTSTAVSSAGIPFDRAFGLTPDRVPIAPFGQWTTYAIVEALKGAQLRPALRAIHVARDLTSVPHLTEYRAAAASASGTARIHLTRDAGGAGAEADTSGDARDRSVLAAVVTDPGWVHVIACGPRAFEETMRAHLADIGVPAGSVASDPFFIPSG